MKFINFEFIPLMLVPSFILLYLIITNKSTIERIFHPEVLKKLKIDQGLPKRLRVSLLFFALFMMILAMARPVIQKGVVEVESKRADLVIALDISKSMKANDLYPDRLTFAKQKIKRLIDRANNLRLGVIAFAKDAFIVSPITEDKEALKFLLDRLDTRVLSLKGTNIQAALMSANLLFGNRKPKNILLVTDGGDQKDFSQEIAYAKKNGMKIFVLAVGTKKGAPIKENGHLVTDKNGNIVVVRVNEAIKELANKTSGLFLLARLDESDITTLLQNLQGNPKETKREKIIDQTELYPYLLMLALLFLFLAYFDLPTKVVFILPFLLTLHLEAGLTDFKLIQEAKEAYKRGNFKEAAQLYKKVASLKNSPQSYYDAANALYKAKRYKEAIEYYNRIQTEDMSLEFQKLHNLGNSYFQLKNYKKAIDFYQKALEIKEDPDTKYNLELAKKMMQKKKQQKQQQKQNQSQKQKQKNQNKQQKSQQKSKENKQTKSQKQNNQKKQKQKPQQAKKPQNQPITDREEKKWLKMLQNKNEAPTLLFKAPIKTKKEGHNENPW